MLFRALLVPLGGALTAGGVLLSRPRPSAGVALIGVGCLLFSLATLLVLIEA